MKKQVSYNVYRGLQKPLIFKGFKGRFIYIGLGIIISSLILTTLFAYIFSFVYGALVLFTTLFGGLFLVAKQQKRGLHRKKKVTGVFIFKNIIE